ncbi:hypothetical protein [Castellaniella sp. UC4442_H9]
MKVKNTSRSIIKLLSGENKVTLKPGTEDVYDVDDCDDVQYLIARGDLIETTARAARKAAKASDDGSNAGSDAKKTGSDDKGSK